MAKQLGKKIKESNALTLSKRPDRFKVAITRKLTNGYEVKDMDVSDIKELHRFLSETVYKELTVSEVERRYLRKKDSNIDEGEAENIIHYGKNGSTFRLFGYYNIDGYFVITRIDGKHKTHKS